MARSYVLSPSALQDIRAIVQFIAHQNHTAAARRFRNDLMVRLEKLALRPTAFRVRPEFGANMRLAQFASYLIFYEAIGDTPRIQRVLHAARDLPKALKNDPV